ncbi:moxR-type AAA ATPase, putative chaperone protein (moxR) [Thermococcus gammatolerans EJ3]|uniref:MoxR-type AAA ATPase, putative chaperone protein (MoxR) n=2 Tax=Thermococcus TaxID=2263 RepID=C5A2K9_THEGJ|nr:moxR-type AAA ATPase, putative chaperone protein (moxR) [Thermococcus gammatolerans EJ3]
MIEMIIEKIRTEVKKAIVGMDDVVELMTIALLSNGHILLEGVPGLAKTTLSKNFAKSLNLAFTRVQMTPDLLPADIIGHSFYDMRTGEFKIRKGPIFTNILLVDEINRASPKTQSALLEAMEEKQVTIEGQTFRLPRPFLVIATRNPVEIEGVYDIPTAQADRFMMEIKVSYLSENHEKEMLRRKNLGLFDEAKPVVSKGELEKAAKEVRGVKVSDEIIDYIYSILRATREDERALLGASPRAGEHLLLAAKAKAYLENRSYVIPDDVKSLAVPVLSHRILIKPEYEMEGLTGEEVVREALNRVEVPTG